MPLVTPPKYKENKNTGLFTRILVPELMGYNKGDRFWMIPGEPVSIKGAALTCFFDRDISKNDRHQLRIKYGSLYEQSDCTEDVISWNQPHYLRNYPLLFLIPLAVESTTAGVPVRLFVELLTEKQYMGNPK